MHLHGYEIAAPDVIAESVDGELLIVNLATGVYFRGDSGTAEAWAAVTSGATWDAAEATAAAAAAARSIEAFIAELLAEGLIRERATDAIPAAAPGEIPTESLRLERFEDLQDMLALDPIHDVDPNTGWPQPQ